MYAAGPLTESEYQANRNQAQVIIKRLSTINDSKQLLMQCPFKLGGVQGDLADAGEVFMEPSQGRLYLALPVDDLLIGLQNKPSFGTNNQSNNNDGLENVIANSISSVGSHLDESTDSLEGGLDQNSNVIMEGSQESL